jgi:hypothetical protein
VRGTRPQALEPAIAHATEQPDSLRIPAA